MNHTPAPERLMAPAARRRLAAELRQVCMRISRRTRFENTQKLAPHQFSALAQLEKGIDRPGALARAECVSAPSMSRTLGGLQDSGFVERTPDPQDGRAAVLVLTASGKQALSAVRRSRDAWMLTRLEELSDEECQVLERAREILVRVAAR